MRCGCNHPADSLQLRGSDWQKRGKNLLFTAAEEAKADGGGALKYARVIQGQVTSPESACVLRGAVRKRLGRKPSG